MITFLLTVIIISLSGVLAPGPITAVTIAAGSRRPHAGALIALGHAVVELPLIFLIMAGIGKLLAHEQTRLVIGSVGGLFLLLMAAQMIRSLLRGDNSTKINMQKNPFLSGIILSIGNPYFLLWWATVGMALATRAWQLGALAFGLFALVHWLCDLVWLEILSWTSFKGATFWGRSVQKIVLVICSMALLFFGLMFLYDAARKFILLF